MIRTDDVLSLPVRPGLYLVPCTPLLIKKTFRTREYSLLVASKPKFFREEMNRADVLILSPDPLLWKSDVFEKRKILVDIKNFITEWKQSYAILVYPRISRVLDLEIDRVFLYGSEVFWRDIVYGNTGFKPDAWKENMYNLVTTLGYGFLGLLRLFSSEHIDVVSFLHEIYVYKYCLGISSRTEAFLHKMNYSILLKIIPIIPPIKEAEKTIVISILSDYFTKSLISLPKIAIPVATDRLGEEVVSDLKMLGSLHYKALSLCDNVVEIKGIV